MTELANQTYWELGHATSTNRSFVAVSLHGSEEITLFQSVYNVRYIQGKNSAQHYKIKLDIDN